MNGRRAAPRIEWDSDEFGVLDLDTNVPAGLCAEKERVTLGTPAWLPGLLRELAIERAESAGFGIAA